MASLDLRLSVNTEYCNDEDSQYYSYRHKINMYCDNTATTTTTATTSSDSTTRADPTPSSSEAAPWEAPPTDCSNGPRPARRSPKSPPRSAHGRATAPRSTSTARSPPNSPYGSTPCGKTPTRGATSNTTTGAPPR